MKQIRRMANAELLEARKNAGVYQWEIADRLNLSEAYLSRALRHEFSEAKKQEYLAAINAVLEERGKNDF